MRERIVVLKVEIVVMKIKYGFYVGIDDHTRQRSRLARQLEFHLLEMVAVDVCVAKSMYEVAGLETGHLGGHHEQQGIGCDVEWHTEKTVGATLVELEAQSPSAT